MEEKPQKPPESVRTKIGNILMRKADLRGKILKRAIDEIVDVFARAAEQKKQ